MSPFNIEECARPNILTLQPYRCGRDDYANDGINVLLDANENAVGSALPISALASLSATDPLNRYPDPHQIELKRLLCGLRNTHAHTDRNLAPENLFVGLGSDEAIDLLLRCFCVPGRDKVLTCPPTYGMYHVSAQINDVAIVRVPLLPDAGFQLDVPAVSAALTADPAIRLVYLCSPGNPTSSLLSKDDIGALLHHPTWNGVVVLDEAYVDFAPAGPAASLAEWVLEWPNLVVMQTFSKAFGLANIRTGFAFGPAPIIHLLNNIKAPYNLPGPTSALARQALSPASQDAVRALVAAIAVQRDRIIAEMATISGIGRLRGGTDSNFLLYEVLNTAGEPDSAVAQTVYECLATQKRVVVRYRGSEHGCVGCLRITVGNEPETTRLLTALREVLGELRGQGAQ